MEGLSCAEWASSGRRSPASEPLSVWHDTHPKRLPPDPGPQVGFFPNNCALGFSAPESGTFSLQLWPGSPKVNFVPCQSGLPTPALAAADPPPPTTHLGHWALF